jgi:hypothetical protein
MDRDGTEASEGDLVHIAAIRTRLPRGGDGRARVLSDDLRIAPNLPIPISDHTHSLRRSRSSA